jgi:hypothetical protein
MRVRCSAISRRLQARRRSTNAEATTRRPVRVLMSAVDYGEADGSWQGANPARAFGMVRHGPQFRADSSGIFAGADASVGENNHGSVGRLEKVLVGRTGKFFLGVYFARLFNATGRSAWGGFRRAVARITRMSSPRSWRVRRSVFRWISNLAAALD